MVLSHATVWPIVNGNEDFACDYKWYREVHMLHKASRQRPYYYFLLRPCMGPCCAEVTGCKSKVPFSPEFNPACLSWAEFLITSYCVHFS